MSVNRFVDAVVDHLVNQVVQPRRTGVTDIHCRSGSNPFNALQMLNIRAIVAAAFLLLSCGCCVCDIVVGIRWKFSGSRVFSSGI